MLDLNRLWQDIGHAYDRNIADAGKQPQAVALVAFLVTFLAVRLITHAIRDGKLRRVLRNVQAGGTHIHHLVPGILLLLASGYLLLAIGPSGPREPVAVLFGIGAALTLDEFALWLHLEDVYWAKQGRQSVDAVVVAATIAALVVLGAGFWVDLGRALGRFAGV